LKSNCKGGPSSDRTLSVTSATEFVQVKEATVFGVKGGYLQVKRNANNRHSKGQNEINSFKFHLKKKPAVLSITSQPNPVYKTTIIMQKKPFITHNNFFLKN
jgi:hypothetical protein